MTRGADMLGNLRRSDADAAACGMNEHGFAGFQAAHHHNELPRREIVDRDRRALQCRHICGTREDLIGRNTNHVGITAKSRHRENVAASPTAINAGTDRVDAAADLVARHDRHRRQVRIDTQAGP